MKNDELRAAAKLLQSKNTIANRYDNAGSLLARAYLAEHPEGAPNWYSKAEISHWLRIKNYSSQIAEELAGIIAANYQLAFEKGFAMGKSIKEIPRNPPTSP